MDTRTEYLNPLFDRFGAHQGLNADWNTMAWRVLEADYWILDDESPDETVSLVRKDLTIDDEINIVEITSGSVETVLETLDALRKILKG